MLFVESHFITEGYVVVARTEKAVTAVPVLGRTQMKMCKAWEPYRSSNVFFRPPGLHTNMLIVCAVTYTYD